MKMLALAVITSLICATACQMDCSYPDNDIIEDGIEVLLEPAQGQRPTVTLLQWEPVCLAFGEMLGRYRGISLVAEYNCNGSACPNPQPAVEQFEFACDGTIGEWGTNILGASSGQRTTPPDASFTTPLRENCAYCISPTSANSIPGVEPGDVEINHCFSCAQECIDRGNLMRCYGISDSQCCNVYRNTTCAVNCTTENFEPSSSTGVCGCITGKTGDNCDEDVDCGALTNPTDGEVSQSATTYQSMATYMCNIRFYLVGVTTRTCEADGKWSGMAPNCTACPANCLACKETGCEECDKDYKLENGNCKKRGFPIAIIIGIVVGAALIIIIVIILVAIAAGCGVHHKNKKNKVEKEVDHELK